MKRFPALLAAFFLSILFSVAAANFQLCVDRSVSWLLSKKFHASISVQEIHFLKKGQARFENLAIHTQRDAAVIVQAGKGICFYSQFFNSGRGLSFVLENVTLGEFFQKKITTLSALSKTVLPSNLDLERVSLSVRVDGDLLHARLLNAKARGMELVGGVDSNGGILKKINLRCTVSEDLVSRWPRAITQKMAPRASGGRGVGVVFGGRTWTLRGSRGPIIQFSADLASR